MFNCCAKQSLLFHKNYVDQNLTLTSVYTQVLYVDCKPHLNKRGYFSLFSCNWEASETDFYFIANKSTEGYLVPEMRKADYFLLIKNYIDETDLENLISSVNRIPEIVAAVKIDPKKIKSRENLLF